MLAHIAYLNAFLDYEWMNPVFWTLAIEFQFYLALGILFPLLVHQHTEARPLNLLGLASLSLVITDKRLLPHWFALFALGFAAFQLKCRLLPAARAVPLLLLLLVITWQTLGAVTAVCAACTVGVILLADQLAELAIWHPSHAVGSSPIRCICCMSRLVAALWS